MNKLSIRLIPLFAFFFICPIACKKNNGGGGGNNTGNTSGGLLIRIQQGTDRDLTIDTVYRITYNSSGKISTLADSLLKDTLTANYDVTGNLTKLLDSDPINGGNANFTYDASGALIQIDYINAGSAERFTYTYTNGIVSKRSYYSNLGLGGAVKLQGYFAYTVTDGNITDIKEYTAGGSLVTETKYTFGSQENPYKYLSLFNYANRLGTDLIITNETYFNKNLVAGFSSSGLTSTISYTLNSTKQVSKAIANDQVNGGGVFTWQFFYK